MNQPLPTNAIELERHPEPQAAHVDGEDLRVVSQISLKGK